jgi:hypothetical protein
VYEVFIEPKVNKLERDVSYMVNIGDVLYNWRYGALKVLKIEEKFYYGEIYKYFITDIVDKNGVVDDPKLPGSEWNKYLREPVKIFRVQSLGYWIHTNIDDAICGNIIDPPVDGVPIKQGQTPLALQFPIKGHLFHQIHVPFITEILSQLPKIPKLIKEVDQNIKDVQNLIQRLPSEYNGYKTSIKKIIDEILIIDFLEFIDELIKNCPSEEEIMKNSNDAVVKQQIEEAKIRVDILYYLKNNLTKNGFDFKGCQATLIEKEKGEFTNDSAYKDYTVAVDKQIKTVQSEGKVVENRIIALLKKISDVKSTEKIEQVIKSKSENVYSIDRVLIDIINACLDEEIANDNAKYKQGLKEFNAEKDKLNKYNNLADPNYVVFLNDYNSKAIV